MARPNHTLVMLMIAFLENEKKTYFARIHNAQSEYHNMLHRCNATGCNKYREEVGFAKDTWEILYGEMVDSNVEDMIFKLRMILAEN